MTKDKTIEEQAAVIEDLRDVITKIDILAREQFTEAVKIASCAVMGLVKMKQATTLEQSKALAADSLLELTALLDAFGRPDSGSN